MTQKKRAVTKRMIARRAAAGLLIAVLIAFCVALLIAKMTNRILFIGQKTVVFVVTGSMEPTIPAKSFIVLEKANPQSIEIGDIILFISDDPQIRGAYNTHQVVDVIGDHAEFVTKGSANSASDAYTAKAENIRGRFVRTCPGLSTIANWFLTRAGLIVTLLLIVLLCVAVYLPDILRKSLKKQNEEQEKEKRAYIEERIQAEIERLKREGLDPNTDSFPTDSQEKRV